MEGICNAGMVIDFDSIDCTLPEGHAGSHRCNGEDGLFYWSSVPAVVPTSDDLAEKFQRIREAADLAECLRAVLDYYAELSEDGWWPFDQDTADFKRGAMREDRFWRTQIEGALLIHADPNHADGGQA